MILKGRIAITCLVLAAWLGLVATGFVFWERYESTPGKIERAEDTAHLSRGMWELVLFVHPHCPCTRASLQELAELAHRAGPNVAIRVVFVRPSNVPEGWERSDLWDAAAAIPGVQVSCDPEGSEARRAGAATSGHLVVYDPSGRIAFNGGITRGRGQTGESSARREILDLLTGGRPNIGQTPVYGCELFALDKCDDTQKGTSCQQ
jgi:hypothetical protein